MIDYFKGVYGVNLLFRVHGSSLYKGAIVGLVSVLVYLAVVLQWNKNRDLDPDLDHPYGVGVLVSSVSFLIIFRANYGYQRYWEAVGSVNAFMSKWMDATIHASVFHLQSSTYDGARPPSFFDHDDLNKLNLTRNRKRYSSTEQRLTSVYDCKKERGTTFVVRSPSDACYEDGVSSEGKDGSKTERGDGAPANGQIQRPARPSSPRRKTNLPNSVLEGVWDIIPIAAAASPATIRRTTLNSELFPSNQCPNRNFGVRPDRRTPPLFLQELAHLSSLACAVALSTLRNDIEYSESPLDLYVPGSAWPESDPDRLPKHHRVFFQHRYRPVTILRHWLGLDRLPHWRSRYNAARPLLILGGVSNGEITFLQRARGPHAKTQLALGWLKEYIVREHLEGSLGEVHSAIISRLVQFLSDGMLHYHQARKVMYIPFPFPHAQLSVVFMLVMILAVPFLMDQYTNELWMGCLVTFLTVTCLAGLHEVARELESPFRNVPNEIPLCTLMAKYNEALVVMFAGFNPDSFWDGEIYQGALRAAAMARVRGREGGEGGAPPGDAATASPATPTSPAGVGTGAARPAPRKVTFSTTVGTDDDAAEELRGVLARQAAEIEELERSLDGRGVGGAEAPGPTGSVDGGGTPAAAGSGSSVGSDGIGSVC